MIVRRWPLTLRGTGAALLAAGCFVLAHQLGAAELVFLGCLLAALVLVCVSTLWIGARADTAVRTLHPATVTVDEETGVELAVRVRAAIPTSGGAWRDRLPAGLSGDARGDLPTVARPSRGNDSGVVRVTYDVRGERRGHREIGPLTLRMSDPFGIARRTHVVGATTRVTVLPAAPALTPLASFGGDPGGLAPSSSDALGHGADNLIARPYAPGDSMRRIHWRATAHRDELMVREEERESAPEATIVLDRAGARWSEGAGRVPGADDAFERAVTACAAIARRLVLDGYVVEVIDATGRPLVAPLDETGTHADLADLLHVLATTLAEDRDALGGLASLFTGSAAGPVFLVTGALTTSDAAALAPLVHHCALPVLLATNPDAQALAAAAAAGWRTAALSADSSVAEVWADALASGASARDIHGDPSRRGDHART